MSIQAQILTYNTAGLFSLSDMEASNGRLIEAFSNAGAIAFRLPSNAHDGAYCRIRRVGGNNVTIQAAAGQTIDGNAQLSLDDADSFLLVFM